MCRNPRPHPHPSTAHSHVGYQNHAIAKSAQGGFTYLVDTIPSVGVDLKELTLNDLKVVSPASGLQDDSSVHLKTYTSAGQVDGDFVYLDEKIYEDYYAEEPGWYTADSVSNYEPEPCGTEKIAFGRGMIIQSNCGATITCSGEVQKKGPSFAIAKSSEGGFTYSGNATPSKWQLKDFAITPPKSGLQDDSSVHLKTYTSAGQVDGDFVYLDEKIYEDYYAEDPGWYTADSVSNYEPESAAEEEIDAGRMFIIQSNCGATITMPDGYAD